MRAGRDGGCDSRHALSRHRAPRRRWFLSCVATVPRRAGFSSGLPAVFLFPFFLDADRGLAMGVAYSSPSWRHVWWPGMRKPLFFRAHSRREAYRLTRIGVSDDRLYRQAVVTHLDTPARPAPPEAPAKSPVPPSVSG